MLTVAVAALAAASVFLLPGAQVAAAAPLCPNALGGSNFEIDGNLTVDGGGTCIDWLADGSGSAMRSGVLVKDDKPSGPNDDAFGQGTHEDNPNPTIVTGSIPNNKSDLTHFGLYAEAAPNGKFLDLFWSRVQSPQGTTNMDFELNQAFCDPSAPTPATCSTNGVTPVRTVGDKLITYDLAQGGTVPTISIRNWNGSSWDAPTDLTASGGALGSINSSAIAAADSGGLGGFDPFTFGEAAISFDALFPNLESGQCGTLGSAFVKSRSSDSFTAELKDFIAPEKISLSNCTSLTTNATSATIGSPIHDVATLSGATGAAGGTITFKAYGPNDPTCANAPAFTSAAIQVNGNGDYSSGDFTPTALGTYAWTAHYTGDGNNSPSDTACGDANETSVVIKPHISISKSPDQQTVLIGQTATFTIVVTNDGDSVLTNVIVTDALAPGCARTKADIPALASMDPKATVTYSCTLANVTSSFTNVAVATGTPPVGPDVTAQDTAAVTAVAPATHPAIAIVKNPKSQTVTSGGTATFTITVTNTGDVALTNVTVSDALSPNCNRTIGTLNPGQSTSYTCTRANVTASFTNVAVATGHAGATAVTAQDTAPVTARAPLKPKKVVKVTPKVVSHRKPKATG
jgi:uncharacterized repeat protein (TIGR01451 family)